jgi:diguanylate cyclase (GGDEF)-like protein
VPAHHWRTPTRLILENFAYRPMPLWMDLLSQRLDLARLGFGPGQRFTRRQLAFSTPIWGAFCGAFAFLAVALAVIGTFELMPGAERSGILLLAGSFVVFVTVILVAPRPRFDHWWSHVVLSAVYIGPTAAMVAFAPRGAAVLPSAMFVGPLIATWLGDRRLALAHLIAASLLLLAPSALGVTDQSTLFATMRLLPSVWFLGVLCIVVQEAAEAQGAELERLARRDPLTGLGNRRLLDERLAEEFTGERVERPLTILALDLDGFKAVNDQLGHAAGDALLVDVAQILQSSVRSYDTVVRQGGDEFIVLLPETDAAGAARIVNDVRGALRALDATPVTVTTGIGVATFPHDGTTAAALLARADARLIADKQAPRPHMAASRPVVPAAPPAASAAAPQAAPPGPAAFQLDISRHAIAQHRWVWAITGAMFLVNALLAAVLAFRSPQLTTSALPFVVVGGTLIGVTILATRPPRIGSAANHLLVALGYITPLATLLACQPGGSVGIGSSIFIGPLAAARLIDRRHIVRHLAAASGLFLGAAVTGMVDPPTVLGIVLLVLSFWLLGVCIAVVLEVAEAQGDELQWLVRRDPLTGAANRRHLDEWLTRQLARAVRADRPISVIAFDLNGFKAVNHRHGHPAGDRLLQDVAAQLSTLATGDRLLARLGGDEFVLVLPGSSAEHASDIAEQAVRALSTIDSDGVALTTGIGLATAPGDAATAPALLDAADARLIANKAGGAATRRRRSPAPHLGTAFADSRRAT